MSVIQIEIKGLKEAERKLLRLEGKIGQRVLTRALRKGAKIVQRAAVTNAPKRTGLLRRSIKVRAAKANRKGTYAVMVTSGETGNLFTGKAYYGGFQELGWRVGKRGKRASVRLRGDNRRQVPARPFMRPALAKNEMAVRNVILTEMVKGIEAVAKRK